MTKSEEIAVLKQFAGRLDANSYCGAFIADIIPQLEAAIISDLDPYAARVPTVNEQINSERELAAQRRELSTLQFDLEQRARELDSKQKMLDESAARVLRQQQQISKVHRVLNEIAY